MNFSDRAELIYLAELTAAVRDAAPDVPFYLAGALARDLLFHYAHDIDVGRQTRDVDLAFAVESWDQFDMLQTRLIATGQFEMHGQVAHRLYFDGWLEVDFIPFGAIERPDRTIAWPPDGAFVMGVFGFQEVYNATVPVHLPKGQQIRVVSPAALATLKLLAWQERRMSASGKDAHDISLILRNYLDVGNHERLYSEAAHLLDAPEFDYEIAGTWLLGHDMALLLPPQAHQRILDMLEQATDSRGHLWLVGDMPIEPSHALRLLQQLELGFMAGMTE